MNTQIESEVNTEQEEQMEDLTAVQDELNAKFRQQQYAKLRTPSGAIGFIKVKLNRVVHNLMTKPSWQKPFGVVLFYIVAMGLYHIFASLISYKTVAVVLICVLLAYTNELKSLIKYINHLSFRVKSVFIKRK